MRMVVGLGMEGQATHLIISTEALVVIMLPARRPPHAPCRNHATSISHQLGRVEGGEEWSAKGRGGERRGREEKGRAAGACNGRGKAEWGAE